MKAWLYILKCADGSYYTGSTNNLPLRLAQHQAGEGGAYTSGRLPVELVYSQDFPSEHQAFLRERQVKGWSRAKKAALIHGDYEALVSCPGAAPLHSQTQVTLSPSKGDGQMQDASFDKLRMLVRTSSGC